MGSEADRLQKTPSEREGNGGKLFTVLPCEPILAAAGDRHAKKICKQRRGLPRTKTTSDHCNHPRLCVPIATDSVTLCNALPTSVTTGLEGLESTQ
jgi:hypothetical protein